MIIETIGWFPNEHQIDLLRATAYVHGYATHIHSPERIEVYPKGFLSSGNVVPLCKSMANHILDVAGFKSQQVEIIPQFANDDFENGTWH